MATNVFRFPKANLEHVPFELLSFSHAAIQSAGVYPFSSEEETIIFYCLEGRGTILHDSTTISVTADDCILINPHSVLTMKADATTGIAFAKLGLSGFSFTFDYSSYSSELNIIHCSRESDSIRMLMSLIKKEAEQNEEGFDIICKNTAESILLSLLRKEHIEMCGAFNPKLPAEVNLCKAYIDSHYMDDITLNRLADVSHVSSSYLSHSFSKHMEQSPIEYLTQRRIHAACEIIETTRLPLSDVATATGFASQSYFCSVFRRVMNMSPAQYQRSLRAHLKE